MMGIDYRYIKAFQYTAKHLNFSKAANELKIAQSAVSRQVKLLEESLDEQLIIRSSKKVMLTSKGKKLLLAINHFEEMTKAINKNSGPGIIRMGILHGLLETWFIDVVKSYAKKSKSSLVIKIDTPEVLKQKLVDGELDLIFSTQNIQSELITSLRLFEENLVIISKNEIETKNLDEHTWITYSSNDFLYQISKKSAKQIIQVASMTAIIKMVKEGIGIAVVPSHTLNSKDKLSFLPVKGLKRPQIFLSTLNFHTLPKYISELVEIAKKDLK